MLGLNKVLVVGKHIRERWAHRLELWAKDFSRNLMANIQFKMGKMLREI